ISITPARALGIALLGIGAALSLVRLRVSRNTKVWTALVTVYIIWGSTYLGIAYAGETIAPLFAASTRFITAGSLMSAVVLYVRRGTLRMARRELLSCSVVGCLLPGGNAV